MKVFFDTNALVSALTTRGLCAELVRWVLAEHRPVFGEVVLGELERVLRERFGVPAETVGRFLALLREHPVAERPAAPHPLALCDPDDRWVLASAVAAGAEVLVTGDRDLLDAADRAPLAVMDPRRFFEMLRGVAPEVSSGEIHEPAARYGSGPGRRS